MSSPTFALSGEADTAQNPDVERLCWYVYTDGSGGFTVNRVADNDSALAFGLEVALALEEFLEMETRPVLDLDVSDASHRSRDATHERVTSSAAGESLTATGEPHLRAPWLTAP